MDTIFEKSDRFTMNTYKRFKVVFDYGKGVYLYSHDGKKYLDFLAGIAVNVLGHGHKVVVDSLKRQAEKLIHVSNLYYIKEQAELAELLVNNSCCDRAFFTNSGAEANETAIKLVRKWGNPKRYKILSFENSFHGRTLASLALTGQNKYQKGFEPMPEGFYYARFNDFDDFLEKIDDKTVAVFVELIQGEGGINVADKNFIKKVYSYCKNNEILFVVDEIQTGMGRTGKLFAYEHYGIEPDVITLAKGVAAGLPMGVTLAKEHVARAFDYGSHGSTFGGNPLASYVASEVLNFILNNGLIDKAKDLGNYLFDRLNRAIGSHPSVEGITGIGLMAGVKFKDKKIVDDLVKEALESGILLGKAGDRTIRLEPPLIIEKSHIELVVDFFRRSI